jgi:hypothetical protein
MARGQISWSNLDMAGGGRPDLAQAGGPDGARAEAAIEVIVARIAGGTGATTSAEAAASAEPA